MGAIDKARVTLTAVKTIKKILRNTPYKLKIFIVLGSNSPLKTHVRSALNLEKSFKIVVNPLILFNFIDYLKSHFLNLI